jgi:hypothetical protein
LIVTTPLSIEYRRQTTIESGHLVYLKIGQVAHKQAPRPVQAWVAKALLVSFVRKHIRGGNVMAVKKWLKNHSAGSVQKTVQLTELKS